MISLNDDARKPRETLAAPPAPEPATTLGTADPPTAAQRRCDHAAARGWSDRLSARLGATSPRIYSTRSPRLHDRLLYAELKLLKSYGTRSRP